MQAEVSFQNRIISRQIGKSRQGRPLSVDLHGDPSHPLRVLIVAGQHGDEPIARQAACRFSSRQAASLSGNLHAQIALIRDANPDGAQAGIRHNAAGHDLNRDHQRLRAVETRALHRFAHRWQPQLIIDVHTFPARRKTMLRQRLVYAHDVMLDVANHPAVGDRSRRDALGMVRTVSQQLCGDGYLADRYLLFRRSGRIRHSTPDVCDLRNFLALRCQAMTVLLEGREPTRLDRSGAADRVDQALRSALVRVLQHAATNRGKLLANFGDQASRISGQPVSIRCRHVPSPRPLEMCFADPETLARRTVQISRRYTHTVESTQETLAPVAYAIPRRLATVNTLLQRHGFLTACDDGPARQVERYAIDSARPSRHANRAPRVRVSTVQVRQSLDRHTIYPTDQFGGRMLSVLLEPQSKYGLARFGDYGLSLRPGTSYPILRVL